MSAPPVPSLLTSIGIVFRFQSIRFLRGKKLRLAAASVLVVVIGILTTRFLVTDADPAAVVRSGFDLGFLHLLVYLLPFLFGSGVIAEEVEARTFTFVAGRPIGRTAIAFGKYLSATAMTIGLLVVGMLIVHVVGLAGSSALGEKFGETARAMGALSLLSATYCAICFAWGAIAVEAAGIIAALYLVVIEFGGSLMPWLLRLMSMNYMASELAGFDKGGLFSDTVPDVQPGVACGVMAALAAFFLVLAWQVIVSSEFRFSRA